MDTRPRYNPCLVNRNKGILLFTLNDSSRDVPKHYKSTLVCVSRYYLLLNFDKHNSGTIYLPVVPSLTHSFVLTALDASTNVITIKPDHVGAGAAALLLITQFASLALALALRATTSKLNIRRAR